MQVTGGNAETDGREFGFWFIGDLEQWSARRQERNEFGLRQSDAVEIKWGTHRAGERRAAWAPRSDKITMSLLVSGKFLLQFRSPLAHDRLEEKRLELPGDYAVWGTDVEHTWLVEEDAVILTVRWKSTAQE